MYPESDLLPLSGLQHLAYCPRQWGLIHLEQAWAENRFTAEGQVMHRHAHEESHESRPGVHIARGLRLQSLRLGLAGQADIVEFLPAAEDEPAVALPHKRGRWRPFPVEYKRGQPKKGGFDRIQLCAQALCLEEMLGIAIPEGALYYGKTRHRHPVAFDDALRGETEALAARMHALWEAGQTPPPEPGPKCEQCSLLELCMPAAAGENARAKRYLAEMFETAEP